MDFSKPVDVAIKSTPPPKPKKSKKKSLDSESSDEGIDGLIAAVLQDIEIKEAVNELSEGQQGDETTGGTLGIMMHFFGNNIPPQLQTIDDEQTHHPNQNSLPKVHNVPIIGQSKSLENINMANQYANAMDALAESPKAIIQKSQSYVNNNLHNYNNNNNNNNNNTHRIPLHTIPQQSSTNNTPSFLPFFGSTQTSIPLSKTKQIDNNMPSLQARALSMTSVVPKPRNSQSPRKRKIPRKTPKQIAINTIRRFLREVDEDKNGEVDFEEFQEGLYQIDQSISANDTKLIFGQCVWNDFDELNIALFCKLIEQRTTKNCKKQSKNNTAKSVLRKAFPEIFGSSDHLSSLSKLSPSPSLSPSNSGNTWGLSKSELTSESLNKIYAVLKEMDDDNNGEIDCGEFGEAMQELAPAIPIEFIEVAFDKLVAVDSGNKNGGDEKELNIEHFMEKLSTVPAHVSMQSHQVLQFYLQPLMPTKSRRSKNRKLKNRSKSKKSLAISGLHKKHMRANSALPYYASTTTVSRSKSMKTVRVSTIDKKSSILESNNASVVVVTALKKQMREVDDNTDGNIDFGEWNEVMDGLNCVWAFSKKKRIFDKLVASADNNELNITQFLSEISKMYDIDSHMTGLECIEKVAQKMVARCNKRLSRSSKSSNTSFASTLSVTSRHAASPKLPRNQVFVFFDDEKDKKDVIAEVRNALSLCAEENNGYMDKEEFLDFLSEYNIDEKITSDDINLIFMRLIDSDDLDHSDEALCQTFIDILINVCNDHPKYSARRAVFRVCRRLLKKK